MLRERRSGVAVKVTYKRPFGTIDQLRGVGGLEEDILLPVQWDGMNAAPVDEPMHRLCQALILHAVRDLQHYRLAKNPEAAHFVRMAREWIWDLDGHDCARRGEAYPITFRTAVEIAFREIDPETLSKALLRYVPDGVGQGIRRHFVARHQRGARRRAA